MRWLVRHQRPDGGFALSAHTPSNAQSTAFAVQGLLAAGRDPARVRRRGSRSPIAFLRTLVDSEGAISYSRTSRQTPVWVTAQALAALAQKPLPIMPPPTSSGQFESISDGQTCHSMRWRERQRASLRPGRPGCRMGGAPCVVYTSRNPPADPGGLMPQYMLLIYSPTEGGPSPEAAQAEYPRWMEYSQSLVDAGAMVAGDPLEGIDTATTVRVRGGETAVTDGPFAETKEVLGGYYIIDVADLDAALGWAAKVPNVGYGSIEVRPVMAIPDMPRAADAEKAGAQA